MVLHKGRGNLKICVQEKDHKNPAGWNIGGFSLDSKIVMNDAQVHGCYPSVLVPVVHLQPIDAAPGRAPQAPRA